MDEQQFGDGARAGTRGKYLAAATLGGWVAASCFGLMVTAGCGGSEEEVKYPPQQPQQQPLQQPAPAQQQPQPAPAQTATAPAAPQPLDAATQQMLKTTIDERAKQEAKGMKPVGEVFGATVPAGGQADSPQFMVEVGKCYTVIAQGGAGVTEVNIEMKPAQAIPAIQMPTVAVDNTTGPQAAITPCWENGFGIGFPAVVSLKAAGGSGPIAGQIYFK